MSDIGKLYRSIKDPLADIDGDELEFSLGEDDSLGEFAVQILGAGDTTEILGAGERPTILGGYDEFAGEQTDESGQWLHKLNPSYWLKSSRKRPYINIERKKRKRAGETSKEAIAAARTQRRRAFELALKIKAGERLGPDEIAELRTILRGRKVLLRFRKALVSGEYNPQNPEQSPDFFAGEYNPQNPEQSHDFFAGEQTPQTPEQSANIFAGQDSALGRTPTEKEWIEMTALATARPGKLKGYVRQHGLKLGPKQIGHIKTMRALTKKALAKQALVSGATEEELTGDFVGKVLKTLGKAAILPAAALAYGAYRGGKWVGKKIFGKKPSAAQRRRAARLKKQQASVKRRIAAEARRQAAEAETDEARRAAEASASAADAEASADEAEAEAQEAQAQMEAGVAPEGGEGDEGEAMGGENNPQFPGQSADHFAGEFIGEWVDMIGDARTKKIVKAAASKTPLGVKIRAGAKVYKAAKAGNPAAKKAVVKMATKAKAGDPQAKRDLAAVRAGKVAVTAKPKVMAKLARAKRAEARKARVSAIRNRAEAALAKPLIRTSRRLAMRRAATVERKAAAGNLKAKAVVAKAVSRAKAGDKKAMAAVKAMQLARHVRKAAPTAAERKNLRQARRLAIKARKGDPRAKKQLEIIAAAARAGNPRAKRTAARIRTADKLAQAVRTGKVPPVKKPVDKAKAATVAKKAVAKVRAGKASREEALLGARAAKAAGSPATAAALANAASQLPSAAQPIKSAAAVAAAAQLGNPTAQATVKETLDRAKAGDPAGINGAGQLAAVQALDAVKRGEPMPKPVAEAVGIVDRAKAGDPEAKRIVERVSSGIEEKDPKAIEAGVALVAAASVAAATAARPGARAEWRDKASETMGTKISKKDRPAAEKELRDIWVKSIHNQLTSVSEAEHGVRLATALGKTKIAAELSAKLSALRSTEPPHPMSAFPEALPPVTSFWDALKEGFKALTFSTKDPLQNYREGLKSRERETPLMPPGARPKV